MKWSEFSHDPLAPFAIVLSLASIGGILLSALAIVTGLLGTLFVYLYPGSPYSPPIQEIPYTSTPKTKTFSTSTTTPTLAAPQKIQPIIIPTDTPTPDTSPTPIITIELVSLTTPIGQGRRATLEIKTLPDQRCLIYYYTPLGNLSEANELVSQTSDASGICRWTWTIGNLTTLGTGSITVHVGGITTKYDIEIIDD